MQNFKLTELLEGLTHSEYKRFGDFIVSPFYNKNKKLIFLYEYFEKCLSNSALKYIERNDIWNYLFPGEAYNDLKIRSILSDFKKLVEKFIVITGEEKKSLLQKNVLLSGLLERNLPKNFDSLSNEIIKTLKKEFNRNGDYYYNKLSLERTVLTQEGKNIEVNLDSKYFKLSDTIDYFFFATKLELINSLLSRRYHVLGSIKLNIKFAEEIISYIRKSVIEIKKDNPIIYSEYLIFMMMTSSGDDKYFFELHDMVLKNIGKYNHSELEQVYYPLINYGFNKVAMGENEYLKNIYEIYSKFEKKGFYSEKIIFQDIDFISIIIIGLRLKKTPWVENFYSKYKAILRPENKDDTSNLALALISFNKKDYDASIGLLSKVNYQNSYYYIKSKETLMQIYYEQQEYESLQSLIDATKHYLKRHKGILSIHYERYLTFMKIINMLLKAKLKDKDEAGILKHELKKHKNAVAREWLFEKVNELK
ncbi:MAG: hypothetical protein M3R36_03350 [Bacteroidota bacterium]|nr:hypothetical protein [Bacteroidota bacterium]